MVDIDSGKMVMSTKEDLLQVSPLLNTPPLAIPLKLYGIKKSTSSLSQDDLAAVIDKVGNNHSSLAWCWVSLICQTSKTFPLPANVRYNMNVENDGNLALDLVELGLFEIITSLAEWEKEVSDNGLDWMLDPMTMPSSLSFLPNPVPLAVGQWLLVSVEELEYIFNGAVEKEPDIETLHVNRIAVQFKPLLINSTFDQDQDYIYWSIKRISHQVWFYNFVNIT